MLGILGQQLLKAQNSFGIGKGVAPAGVEQRAACFSEIPPGQWERLVERRQTKHGIAFSKSYLLKRGGGPIWYAYKNTPHWWSLQKMLIDDKENENANIWKIAPMIDAPGKYGEKSYEFEWEREWRHVGDMHFEIADVAFLLIPENLHDAARSFFENAYRENIGPAYFCPYVDPTWSKEKILQELRNPTYPPTYQL
jgi:hypothetical protein